MRICVIGNSHVAALKHAWDVNPTWHDRFSLRFFAARAQRLRELEPRAGTLVPRTSTLERELSSTSGGSTSIDPQEYDAFLVYGLEAHAMLVDPAHGYSSAVLERSVADHLAGITAMETIRSIRDVSDRPIYVGHKPMRAVTGPGTEQANTAEYSYGIDLLNQFGYSRWGAVLLRQPLGTIAGRRRTKAEYSTGSVKLAVGRENDGDPHGDPDRMHMNTAFGEEWLRDFLDVVERPPEVL